MKIITKLFFIFLFLGLLAGLFFVVWQVYTPAAPNSNHTTMYTIKKGDGVLAIGRGLAGQSLIKSALLFEAYSVATGQRSKLQAGTYEISPAMSIAQMVGKFVSGDIVKETVTIIDGWDARDIAGYLAGKHIYPEKDFLATASGKGTDWAKDFDFLKDRPKSASLEGYLFPDTYYLLPGEPPDGLVKDMLDNFGKKLTPQLRQDIAAQHKTIFEIVTMASLLEKEVKTPEDKKIVAGILWKRLNNGMPLQVDATINFITGKTGSNISLQDIKIDSPYNTYRYAGLPAGPIANPGIDSIMAAMYPQKSPYWYYLSTTHPDTTIFSTTLAEHQQAIKKYLSK